MNNPRLLLVLAVMLCIGFVVSQNCHGVQDIGAGTIPIDAEGQANGCSFSADSILRVTAGATVNNNDNPDGVVTTVGNDTGTVRFVGSSVTKGNFGASGAALKRIGANGAGTTVVFGGNVFVTTLNYGADGTVTMADQKTLTGGITTDTTNTGTLTMNGTGGVTGQIGTNAKRLKEVEGGSAGGVVTFSSDVYSVLTSVINTGTLVFNGNLTGTTLNFEAGADGVVQMADGSNLKPDVTTANSGSGTLTFMGDSTVSGKIGAVGAVLKQVNVNGGAGETVAFNDGVRATALNFGGDGTITLANNRTLAADITSTTVNNGTITFLGDATMNGKIGLTNANIRQVNIDGVGGGFVVDFKDGIHSEGLNFGDNNTITLTNNSNLDTTVTTSNNNTGTITFLGNSNATGAIGTSAMILNRINVSGAGNTVTFKGDVFATTIDINGAGGIIKVQSGDNLNAAVENSAGGGTLTFNGATTTGGTIGAVNPLTAVNFNGPTNLGHDIASTDTTVRSGSTVKLTRDVTVTGDLTVTNNADSVMDIGTHTLTLLGSGRYIQRANSKLIVGVSGATAGSIVGSGNANINLASVLDVVVGSYVPNNTAFKIVDSAGGVNVNVPGTITSSSPMYTFAGTTTPGDLTITATRANTFNGVATGNGAAAGAVLESVAASGATGDMLALINALDSLPTTEAINAALQTLVPVVDGGVPTTSNIALNQFVNTTLAHLQSAIIPSSAATGVATGGDYLKGVDIWADGFGDYAHQDARQATNGYDATVWGTAIGFDRPVRGDNVRVGISGGYAQSFVRSKDNSGRTDIDSYQGTLYGGYQDENYPYYVDCAFTFAYNTYDSSRHIAFGGIDRIAASDYNGQQYSVLADFGYGFNCRNLKITPMVSAQYMRLHVSDYTEHDAGAAGLQVDSQNYDLFQTGFGAKFEYPVKIKYGTIVPEMHAKWLYDFIGDTQATTSTFSGGGGSFATTGFTPAQSTWDFGGKLSLLTKNNFTIQANYDFQVKEDYWEHTGWLELVYRI